MERRLELHCDAIEQTLAQHDVRLCVTGGKIHPRFITFQCLLELGQKVGDVRRRADEVALALNAPGVRIARTRGEVVIQVPRDDPQPVLLLPLLDRLDNIPPLTAVLGLSTEGSPLLLNLRSPDVPHVLIAGTTGCGKSELLRTIALSLAATNKTCDLGLLAIGRKLDELKELPHLVKPSVTASSSEEALVSLVSLVDEMEARLEKGRYRVAIVVVIDELADLLMAGGHELAAALTRLTQKGRNAGIHVIAATQKPTAAVIGSLVKANFPVRIVGSVASPEDAKVASGVAGTGAEQLLGWGDFLVVVHGQTTRFQAAYVSPSALMTALSRIDGQGQSVKLPKRGDDLRSWLKSKLRIVNGRGGHNRQPPTEEMIAFALEVRRASGEWPSKRAIRAEFQCNNRRATETLERAAERWNGKEKSRVEAAGL